MADLFVQFATYDTLIYQTLCYGYIGDIVSNGVLDCRSCFTKIAVARVEYSPLLYGASPRPKRFIGQKLQAHAGVIH
ncbi:hypothetical protein D3C71_2174020 [compost metagenome]